MSTLDLRVRAVAQMLVKPQLLFECQSSCDQVGWLCAAENWHMPIIEVRFKLEKETNGALRSWSKSQRECRLLRRSAYSDDRLSLPFKIKRLAFGHGDIAVTTAVPFTMDLLEASDFVIERRAAEPYSENRYFCSAPMRKPDHIAFLDLIEKELAE
jgi:hypothetical protein